MKGNIDKILDKLRKLMDLKESALQCGEVGEANAAAAGITRLLMEYNLTMQDVYESTGEKVDEPVDVEKVPIQPSYSNERWWADLIATVCNFNNTASFYQLHLKGRSYWIVGKERNREVTLYLISFLANQFLNIGRRKYGEWKINYIRQRGITPPSLGTYMKDFLMGCCRGLWDKLYEEMERFNSEKMTALVKSDKAKINKFMEERGVVKGRSRSSKRVGDCQVIKDGYEVGRNIQINKGVENHTEKQKRLA